MSQNVPSLNCNCTYCKSDASTTTTTLNAAAAAAAPPTAKRKSPFNYSTDRALLRLADRVARRVEPIREYFRPSYMARKGRSYLEAVAAAESTLSGEFSEGSRIRHFSGFAIRPYNFAEYAGREIRLDCKTC